MTLARSILSRFFLLWLMILLGLTGLLSVFDLLANARNVLANHPHALMPLLWYIGLRAQQILSFILPLSVFLAALFLFVRMVLSQEMVILRAVGISVYYVLRVVALGCVAIAIIHLVLSNFWLPRSSATLNQWRAENFAGSPKAMALPTQSSWLIIDDALVYVGSTAKQGHELNTVIWIERDAEGNARNYLAADRAIYRNGEWLLSGVREVSPDAQGPTTTAATMRKNLPVEPKTIRLAGYREEELSYGDLMLLMDEELQLDQTSQPYHFWFQRKIAYPFSSFVMLLIAAPLALQLARRNRLFTASFISMMCALGFYVAQQLFASFGETGLLPPILAAWGPLIIAGALGNWAVLHREN